MEAVVRVALPKWLASLRPLTAKPESWKQAPDVTPLVEEWALIFLDPVEALRANVSAALAQPGWTLAARATLTPATARLMRDAARTDEVGEALRAAGGGVAAMPLLVGLVAVTAVEANLGKAAADALVALSKHEDLQARAAAQRERQRSAPAAAEAARPTLSELAPDAFGEAVR